MLKVCWMTTAALLLIASAAQAQTNSFATGNMHFDAKEMDTNGDQMISREEMMSYSEKMWESMAHGQDTLPVQVAAKDFATGGVAFNAHAIDTDHDGSISKAEFLAYMGRKFDKMKNSNGMVSVTDAAQAFARGNSHPREGMKHAEESQHPSN